MPSWSRRGRAGRERRTGSFYIRDAEEIGVAFEDIDIPRCAMLSDANNKIPVIIIQSERLGEKHTIGYRPLDYGNGICLITEVELLDKPDERFYRNV